MCEVVCMKMVGRKDTPIIVSRGGSGPDPDPGSGPGPRSGPGPEMAAAQRAAATNGPDLGTGAGFCQSTVSILDKHV